VKDFRASGSLRGVFRVALGEIALRLGHRFRVAECGARGAVEDAADGPASVLFREGAFSPRGKRSRRRGASPAGSTSMNKSSPLRSVRSAKCISGERVFADAVLAHASYS
jgi:hypothetical protein